MRLIEEIAWVRRRLLDTGAKQRFSDGDITSALNVGAQLVQVEIQKVAPDAFRRVYLRNSTANIYRYQVPRGLLRINKAFVRYTDGAAFLAMSLTTQGMIEDPASYLNDGSQTGVFYAVAGGELLVFPTPTTAVEDAIKLLYVPALSMSTKDDDLEDMGLAVTLHMAVVLWAVKLLKPEDAEDIKSVDAEIVKIMDQVPTLYGGSGMAGGPEMLMPEGMGLELTQ